LKKVFKLLIGKHYFNEPENGLLVFIIELLDEHHLLGCCFILNNQFTRYLSNEIISLDTMIPKEQDSLQFYSGTGKILQV
jgi:hypothetical protein